MQLDRVATKIVLDNLKSAIPSRRPAMVRMEALADTRSAEAEPRITLPAFLRETGLELEDVFRSGSWSDLQREAGLKVPAPGPHQALIGDRLAGILHVDDPLRLAAYERLATSASVGGLTDAERRLLTGFHFGAIPSQIAPKTLAESVTLLHAHPAIVEELREIIPVLDERSEHLTYPLELAQPDGSSPTRASVRARPPHGGRCPDGVWDPGLRQNRVEADRRHSG